MDVSQHCPNCEALARKIEELQKPMNSLSRRVLMQTQDERDRLRAALKKREESPFSLTISAIMAENRRFKKALEEINKLPASADLQGLIDIRFKAVNIAFKALRGDQEEKT